MYCVKCDNPLYLIGEEKWYCFKCCAIITTKEPKSETTTPEKISLDGLAHLFFQIAKDLGIPLKTIELERKGAD